MKYNELMNEGIKKLEENKIDIKLASYLLTHYLKITEIDKFNNAKINTKLVLKYNKAIAKLIKGEPVQYIMGAVNFFGYPFKLSKSVLIPRFETEELVSYTIEYIKKYFSKQTSIVDIGTGSGIIGLTLKKELPFLDVTITDISRRALSIATSNAKELSAEVTIINGDMLKPLVEKNKKFDIIISNPPYIKVDDLGVEKIVLHNEPHMALYGGKTGLKFYQKILKDAHRILNRQSLIAFEIGESQALDIEKIAKKYLPESCVEIKKDLQGKNRMLFIFNNIND